MIIVLGKLPGMVISGVAHRPQVAPKWILENFGAAHICTACTRRWPCPAVKVGALKRAVIKKQWEVLDVR